MNSNTKKVSMLIVGIFVLVLVIGVSIAYFMSQASSDPYTVSTGTYTISYAEGNVINSSTLYPSNETDAIQYPFTITNSSIAASTLTVKINNTGTYYSPNLKYALYNATKSGTTYTTSGSAVATGSINTTGNITVLSGVSATKSEAKNYILKIWLAESGGDQTSTDAGKTLNATIVVEGKENE